MRLLRASLFACMAFIGISHSAFATATTYYLSGIFADGETLSGSFVVNDALRYPDLTCINLQISRQSVLVNEFRIFDFSASTNTGPISLVFTVPDGEETNIALNFADASYNPDTGIIHEFLSSQITGGFFDQVLGHYMVVTSTHIQFLGGTISTSIPEPMSVSLSGSLLALLGINRYRSKLLQLAASPCSFIRPTSHAAGAT